MSTHVISFIYLTQWKSILYASYFYIWKVHNQYSSVSMMLYYLPIDHIFSTIMLDFLLPVQNFRISSAHFRVPPFQEFHSSSDYHNPDQQVQHIVFQIKICLNGYCPIWPSARCSLANEIWN